MNKTVLDLRQKFELLGSGLQFKTASRDHQYVTCSSKFGGKEVLVKIGKGTYAKYVQKEINIHQQFVGEKGIPTLLFGGTFGDGSAVIVKENPGRSLHDIRISNPRTFDISTIAMIGISITYHLECLHRKGIVHGCICPMNILSGSKYSQSEYELFLINFENSSQYDCGTVNKKSTAFMTVKNIDFAPKAYHKSYLLHPTDDLESLFYTLSFLYNGKLPWSHMMKRNAHDWSEIAMAKQKVTAEDLFNSEFENMKSIFHKICTRKTVRRPSYGDIRRMLRGILTANNVSNEKDFSWLD